jgi:FAD-dependent sensor of blue light
MLNGLIYLSTANTPFSNSDLDALAQISTDMNEKHGITGYLYYSGTQFIQYIEGEEHALEQLMSNIRSDLRHKVNAEIIYRDLAARYFPSWRMKVLDDTADHYKQVESILMGKLSMLNMLDSSQSNLKPNIKLLISSLSKLAQTSS